MDVRITSTVAVFALVSAACGGRTVVVDAPAAPVAPEKMAELWTEPERERGSYLGNRR